LQIVQKVDHLRLDRDVECGDRLVADDQARVERERAGDADALALAAGEFVREAIERPRPAKPTLRARSSSAPEPGRFKPNRPAAVEAAP
jgi:hypothetical protein